MPPTIPDAAAWLIREAHIICEDDCVAIEAGHNRPDAAYRYRLQRAMEAGAAELAELRGLVGRMTPVVVAAVAWLEWPVTMRDELAEAVRTYLEDNE
jgi:hypothetical protein